MKNLTWCSLVFSVLLLFLIPSISFAQITVTSTADSGPGSLRQAVIDSAPNGTIDFDLSGLGAPPHTITLTSGEIVIDKSLRITGSGKTDLIISGNNNSRIFRTETTGSIIFITDLTIQDGDVRGNAGVGGQKGGGIHNTASLLFIADCIMSNNISGGDADGGGGAVFTSTGFRADRCEFLNNQTINLTGDSFGGAIDFSSGAGPIVTIADSRLEGNSSVSLATARGGAIYARSDSVSPPSLNINRTQFINNTAQGNIAQGGVAYTFEANLSFTDSIIIDNTADGVEEGSGGAIHGERGFVGIMTVLFAHNYINSTISRNTARGHLATGGAIHKSDHISIFLNATISENVVESIEGSGTPRALGAAIYSVDDGSETIEASTIVFNQVTGPAGSEFAGAGILQHGNSTETRLNNTIIAGNFYGRTEGVTIIGGSDGTSFASSNCGEFEGSGVPDFQLVNVNITDNGIPLGSPGGDACSVLFNPDFIATKMLGPLQNNGGLTLSHSLIDTRDMAPLAPNPAIDGVPDGQCNRFDQVVGRRFDDFLKPDESIFYRVNNSETYPFNSLLSFEPLFLDHIGDGLFKAIDYEGDIITHDDNEYYDMLEEYQKDAGSGVNSPEMFEDLRGPAVGPPITTDGRPFPRPFDWTDIGIPMCDIGAFELQPLGNIVITKVSNPSGATGFGFQGGATLLPEYGCDLSGMFTLDDGESTAECLLPVGTYTVNETIEDPNSMGFFLDQITCFGSATTTEMGPLISVDIVNDEDAAFCTFLNETGFGGLVSLTVILQGAGTGSAVTGTPGEIDCSSTGNMDCAEVYSPGTSVTLTATPDLGSVFVGWSGDCPATAMNDTTITLNVSSVCIATFDLLPVTLTVEIQGTGAGSVASDASGEIDCRSAGNMDCDEVYDNGENVTLTATPEVGSTFTTWSGDAACTGDPTNPLLMLAMDMDINCIAVFDVIPVTLNVEIQGAGEGGVTASDTLIDCNSTGTMDCDEIYGFGDTVTLTAAPQSGSFFTGWSGDAACTGDPTNPVLDLTMNMDISCIATFELLVTLDVTIQGAGQGGVTSTPVDEIDCSNTGQTDCDETYVPGSMVTLTAAPQPGSFFTGWSGDAACTGDPTNPVLDLTMNMDISCIASFDVIPLTAVTLDVILQGSGSCTVTSSPNVINCEGDCTETFNPPGVTVDLTVTPDPNSIFVDWTGDCNDLNPDTSITVNEDSVCIATCILSDFVLNPVFPAIDDNINSISVEAATPGRNVAFIWSQRRGSFRVGGRVCNGLELGLRNPRILAIKRANDLGVATHIFYIPTFGDLEFQLELQAVDIETCRTSNIVPQIVRKDEGG
ncbi:MAG: hypothetical protein WBB48_07830 [Thermodesulfobacteriota bacterium]